MERVSAYTIVAVLAVFVVTTVVFTPLDGALFALGLGTVLGLFFRARELEW